MGTLQERMRDPPHYGALRDADAVGAVGNPACGDVVTLYLKVADGRITAASFESMGSAYQLATASVLCDCVQGMEVTAARKRTPACILEKLPDLPAKYRYLTRLNVEALHRALDDLEHGVDDDTPGPTATEAEVQAYLLGLLEDGRTWTTRELAAMATAKGLRAPVSTVKCLSHLLAFGKVEGRMDMERRTWTWWRPDTRPGA